MLLDSWFLINFQRWPERIGIYWKKISAGLSILDSLCPENTYRASFLKESVKKFRFFGWVMKFIEQRRKSSSGLPKLPNCPEDQIKENCFLQNKTCCSLKILSELFFTFSGKVRQSCQNCILRSLGIFWGKKLFEA